MGTVGIIILFIGVLVGVFYIHTVGKVGRLHSSARNSAGELDTLLWDRNHVMDQIMEKAEALGVEIPEDCKEKISLSLGMPATMQMTVYTQLLNRGNKVFSLVSENAAASEDEDLKKLFEKFEGLRDRITVAGSDYNRKATEFNAYIETPLAGFIATRKHWGTKNHFNVQIAEASAGKMQ